MKHHLWPNFLLLALIMISCEANPCEEVNCQNGGVCFEGDCRCQPGFSGLDCSENDCDNRTCQNGGNCEQGVCDCPLEYTGIECEKRVTDQYNGVYFTKLEPTNSCLTQRYAVVISNGPQARDLVLLNIQNDGLFTEGYLEVPELILFEEPGIISGGILRNSDNSLYVEFVSNTGPDCSFILERL